ncbi:antirestriction protein [Aureimonas pseudogalii]|uniref:Antirestriction protein n=1 Tax=Aureimonas pseudogalii TaxID=1744844 RepID=A0A7W6MLT8_9HYPH|nr:antirestriction protein [Aureimonas pseudogalii]MBB4000137.1 hypothetical protein [Aureimonas pseudogalii]
MSEATATAIPNRPQAASIVADSRRMTFLPALFGPRRMVAGEATIYNVMGQLSPEYRGGLWDFLELDGKPLYMRHDGEGRIGIQWHGNGFEGIVSTDAAGIIACLLAFSSLSFDDPTDLMADAFHRLREFALDHPEARTIFRAID